MENPFEGSNVVPSSELERRREEKVMQANASEGTQVGEEKTEASITSLVDRLERALRQDK